jgi:hypothetical protein
MRSVRIGIAWASLLIAAAVAAGLWATGIHDQAAAAHAATAPGATAATASSAPAASGDSRALGELPLRRDTPGESARPPWTALVVLLVLAAGAVVLVLRRRGPTGLLRAWPAARGSAAIERIASQPLTPQASVHAVRWHGEELLLGCTGTQVTLLARRPVDTPEKGS